MHYLRNTRQFQRCKASELACRNSWHTATLAHALPQEKASDLHELKTKLWCSLQYSFFFFFVIHCMLKIFNISNRCFIIFRRKCLLMRNWESKGTCQGKEAVAVLPEDKLKNILKYFERKLKESKCK